MKTYIPEFMIAENPLEKMENFLIHNRSPRFLARMFEHDSESAQNSFLDKLKSEVEKKGGFLITTKTHYNSVYYSLVVVELLEEIKGSRKMAQKLAEVIEHAAQWYLDYIRHKEEQLLSNSSN